MLGVRRREYLFLTETKNTLKLCSILHKTVLSKSLMEQINKTQKDLF